MKFNKSNKGYIAILLVFFIPVILLGTKLILDLHTENTEDVGTKNVQKNVLLKLLSTGT